MRRVGLLVALVGVIAGAAAFAGVGAKAGGSNYFTPGNLLVSRSVYDNNPANVTVGETLPPGCTLAPSCVAATADGSYPTVFNNDLVDGSFGITSPIYLDQLTPTGTLVNSLEVPNSTQNGVPPTKDQMVTSFSSKSEVALNLSTDGQYVTFMGYLAPVDAVDVSNSNTPGVIDPSNPVPSAYPRVVAQLDSKGKFRFTETNAYSGNNGRAAILNAAGNVLYTAGNAGNGGNPQPNGVILGAGAQILDPQVKALVAQKPGDPTPVGSFNITQLGDAADKVGKDTNFRGLTVFNNVVYLTKGSGSNGVNTVYFIDTTGTACPSGVGVPAPNAPTPDRADHLRPHVASERRGNPLQHVHPQRVPDQPGQREAKGIAAGEVPVRDLVRERDDALRRRRRERRQHLLHRHWDVHQRRRADNGRPAKVDLQQRNLELRLHTAVGPRPRHPLHPERFVTYLSNG